ncbi:hypothetical protein AVEN_144252-1 [Araneus ventricosus]|uniref:Uncharacterized protein n=1 Tax=Araneus ventricosus TaxID=182803 RepID=A0A4Y2EJJ1_ARAVE|nr:hypothetical protein AVEN_144252-1 [Araneus ventricosus]
MRKLFSRRGRDIQNSSAEEYPISSTVLFFSPKKQMPVCKIFISKTQEVRKKVPENYCLWKEGKKREERQNNSGKLFRSAKREGRRYWRKYMTRETFDPVRGLELIGAHLCRSKQEGNCCSTDAIIERGETGRILY